MHAAELFASLGRFGAVLRPAAKLPPLRATVYAHSAGNRTKRPAGKRGILDDRADECFDGKSPAQRGSGAGSAGSIAPGGASAGSGGPGVCRGLGGAVRSADALWAGPCAGPCGGLLCPLCGGGRAGGAAAWLRGRCRCAASVCCVRWGLRWLCGGSGRADSCPLCWRAAVRWPPWACALRWAPAAGRSWRCSARRTPCWQGCWGWHCGVSRPKKPGFGTLLTGAAVAAALGNLPLERFFPGVAVCAAVELVLCSRGQPGAALACSGMLGAALCAADPALACGAAGLACGRLRPAFWPRAAGWKRLPPMRAAA